MGLVGWLPLVLTFALCFKPHSSLRSVQTLINTTSGLYINIQLNPFNTLFII